MIAGGGAGACVSLIGVRRAFEEARIEPELIVSCSGGTIWGSMWAAGMSAQEMADFSLGWRLEDYLDIQWAKVPRYAAAALKGFTGLAKGAAIERTFDERFGPLTAGELGDPHRPDRLRHGPRAGRLLRHRFNARPDASAGLCGSRSRCPRSSRRSRWAGTSTSTAGSSTCCRSSRSSRDGGFDHVFAINFMLPPQLEPEDITGWNDRPMGVLAASRQAEQGFQLELARRTQRALGDHLTVIDAADHRLLRGPAFYDLFIDRSRWPELIRAGYERTTCALHGLRSQRRRAART